jgi:hypothetical protein
LPDARVNADNLPTISLDAPHHPEVGQRSSPAPSPTPKQPGLPTMLLPAEPTLAALRPTGDPSLATGDYVTQASALTHRATLELQAFPALPTAPASSATAEAAMPLDVQELELDLAPHFAIDHQAMEQMELGFAPSWMMADVGNETSTPWLAQTDDEEPETGPSPDLEALPEADPELGVIRVRNSLLEDPELGILRIREQPEIPVAQAREPRQIGFLTARLSGASSDNILLVLNEFGGLTGDEYLRPGLSFSVYPALGPHTLLIGSADISLQRYTTRSDVNYDDMRFRLGVRQTLFPRTYAQFMFSYQQLFRPGSSRLRFFDNKAYGLTVGRRDPLTSRLVLHSYYQIQYNDSAVRPSTTSPTDTEGYDRLSQYFGGYLAYNISPQFETGVSYQATLADYTGVERYDTYHQVLGQFAYKLTPNVRMSIFGGWSFGRSSRPDISFDDTLFGFTIDATVGLF